MGINWDRIELDARLVDATNRVRELERAAEWLRGLLGPAEVAHQRYRDELARLDGELVAMHQRCGRVATEDERARYQALENQHQRAQDQYREWCWSPSATIEDRAHLGPARSWSTRWPDDVRTKLGGTVAELQLADAQRDNLLAELQALNTQPVEVDVPGSRPWLDRLLGT